MKPQTDEQSAIKTINPKMHCINPLSVVGRKHSDVTGSISQRLTYFLLMSSYFGEKLFVFNANMESYGMRVSAMGFKSFI